MTTHTATGPAWLDERIRAGELVLIDGAMGTELERRGVEMHAITWSANALLAHADVAREIHEDYIRAGAEVIITNTFSTARHMLEPVGLGAEVKHVNCTAVEAARRARDAAADRPVAVAGSISNFMADETDQFWLDPARLRATFDEQAGILAEAGVDLLALEMLERPEMARIALEAALGTGLPVWAGISCRAAPEDRSRLVVRDYPEIDFADLIEAVVECRPGIVNVMHSDVPDTSPGLDQVKGRWSGPIGVYPNSGHFRRPNWQFVDIISPADLVASATEWVERGVSIIGGCCGIGPEHIRALAEHLGRDRHRA